MLLSSDISPMYSILMEFLEIVASAGIIIKDIIIRTIERGFGLRAEYTHLVSVNPRDCQFLIIVIGSPVRDTVYSLGIRNFKRLCSRPELYLISADGYPWLRRLNLLGTPCQRHD